MSTKQFVNLTDSAKNYLLNACLAEERDSIRLEVIGGGCAGFSYKYDFSDKIEPLDMVVDLDDSHKFIVDNLSVMYVIGTEIDYEQKLGSSSLVIKNPNETSSCGCGKSFSI
jgi:iron-sulfur cluster assembly accessory protein